MRHHPKRIVVAGGDGTVATVAAAVSGSETELAVIPGGTLNHFARNHGIPTDADEAVCVARDGRCIQADVGYTGGRLFLNTSVVGAYVTYVRMRERLERYMGYHLASLAAAVRLFFRLRSVRVVLDIDGVQKQYDTPLVFIGVGERELQVPALGNRLPHGRHCLHVLVVRERRAARVLAIALEAMTRGVQAAAQQPELESFLVDRCTLDMAGGMSRIAVDGEIVTMQSPIECRIAVGALTVVVPC